MNNNIVSAAAHGPATMNDALDKVVDQTLCTTDTALAVALGLRSPCPLRRLIERHRKELESYAELVCGADGSYSLTQGQAFVICALSNARYAPFIRARLIETFIDRCHKEEGRRSSIEPATPSTLSYKIEIRGTVDPTVRRFLAYVPSELVNTFSEAFADFMKAPRQDDRPARHGRAG